MGKDIPPKRDMRTQLIRFVEGKCHRDNTSFGPAKTKGEKSREVYLGYPYGSKIGDSRSGKHKLSIDGKPCLVQGEMERQKISPNYFLSSRRIRSEKCFVAI